VFPLLFRHRWLLVLWVLTVLGGISQFVGQGGGVDQIARTAQQIKAQKEASAAAAQPAAAPEPEAEPTEGNAEPQAGDVFVNPETGQQIRVVRRDAGGEGEPAEGQ
jgi:hypothetical protein